MQPRSLSLCCFFGLRFMSKLPGGITDGSKRLFMESDIDPMDSEEILQEGKAGSASVEEWVGASTPSDGGPSIFGQMGGVKIGRDRPDFQNLGQKVRRDTADVTA